MPFTKRQIEILEAQGRYGQRKQVAHLKLGVSQSAINKNNTMVYKDFLTALDLMLEYFPLFKRRLVRDSEEVRRKLLLLNRKIRESARGEDGVL